MMQLKHLSKLPSHQLIFFSVDVSSIEAYQELSKAAENAGNEESLNNYDQSVANIHQLANAAEKAHGDATKIQADVVKTEYDKKIKEAPTKQAEQSLTSEQAAKEKALWDEHYRTKDQIIRTLEKSAIAKLEAAKKAKAELVEKAKQELTARMQELANNPESEDREDTKNARAIAAYSQNLADDGNLSSAFKGQVQDYIGREVILSDGTTKVELKGSDLENISMGITYALHNGDPANTKAPKDFIKGLSDREAASISFDHGVDFQDVQLQVLQTMGTNLRTREERDAAKSSPEGKLITDLAGNEKIPSHLRGMLIGRLAQIKETDPNKRAQAIKDVQQMAALVTAANQPEGSGVDKGVVVGTGLTGLATVGVLGLGLGPLAIAPAIALAGSYAQGAIDENKLESSGLLMLTLEKAVTTQKYRQAYLDYQRSLPAGFQSSAKISFDANKNPATEKDLTQLNKDISVAETSNKAQIVDKFIADKKSETDKIESLYTYFNQTFTFSHEVAAFKTSPISLIEISARLNEKGILLDQLKTSPELVQAAKSKAQDFEAQVTEIQDLKKKNPQKLKELAYDDAKITNPSDPEAVKSTLQKFSKITDDLALAQGVEKQRVEDSKKAARTRQSAPAEDNSSTEKGTTRVDNQEITYERNKDRTNDTGLTRLTTAPFIGPLTLPNDGYYAIKAGENQYIAQYKDNKVTYYKAPSTSPQSGQAKG